MMKKYVSLFVISLCTLAQVQPITGSIGGGRGSNQTTRPTAQPQAAGRGRSMQPSEQPASNQGQNVAQPKQPATPAVVAIDAATAQQSAAAASVEETAASSNAAVGSAATSGTSTEAEKSKDDEKQQQEVKAESKKLKYAAYIGGALALGLSGVAMFYIAKFGGTDAWGKFVEHMVAAGKYTVDNPVVNWTRANPWTSSSLGALLVTGIAAAIDWKREKSLLKAGISQVKTWYQGKEQQKAAEESTTKADGAAASSSNTPPAAPAAVAE